MESRQKNQKQRFNVKSKAQLYECIQRNGWYLPAISSTLVTVQYLLDIKEAKIWCPRYEHLQIRPCPRPPLKNLIIAELQKELDAFKEKRFTGIDDKHQPDVEWLLITLSTVNPKHRYFSKDYVPSVMETRKIFGQMPDFEYQSSEDEYQLQDDFFDDLPDDLFDFNTKKSIIPKSNSQKKKDDIEAAIKIRAKFRQMKHQLDGFKELEGVDDLDYEDERPEEINRFVQKFRQWNLDKFEHSQKSTQGTSTQRNSEVKNRLRQKDQAMTPAMETPVKFDK